MEEYSDIDDFFDFSNESIIMVQEEEEEEEGLSVMASATVDYCHYTEQPAAILDSEELYMPCEEVAHLEWLSNFVEESMSSSVADESLARVISTAANCKEVNQNTIINTLTTNTNTNTNSTSGSGYGCGFSSSASSSSFLRRKRLRLWDPQVILIDTARAASPVKHALFDSPSSTSTLTDSEDELTSSTKKKNKKSNQKNNQNNNQNKQKKVTEEERNAARKCQHCGSTKTPQWRAGPKGPKTLCNACGVRFKSGRLLPQYRPASSPSFDTTLHSNSHRRVLEMQTLIREEEEEEEEEETA